MADPIRSDPPDGEVSRRDFLKTSAVLASGMAALAASLAPLRDLKDYTSMERFLQKHYKEMTPEERERAICHLDSCEVCSASVAAIAAFGFHPEDPAEPRR